MAFHVYVLPRRNILQLVGSRAISWRIPHSPQRTIFGAKAPEDERFDAQSLRGTHLVEGGNRIEEPDVVLQVMLVQIPDVGIEAVAIKIDVFFRVPSGQPGILHGHVGVLAARRQQPAPWLANPVVAVTADGTDQLILRDGSPGGHQVLGKPVL